ncbi:hypothetical protein IFM89_039627 [Coptis chinensis]|uniref:Uncharacterized protein n=1 Tax=Coptis chinensis TaxID=261450 RepID=A0A835GTR0_9MAGN|nr:hypothetical protein IFM89_039627 [Coptis chinensis]
MGRTITGQSSGTDTPVTAASHVLISAPTSFLPPLPPFSLECSTSCLHRFYFPAATTSFLSFCKLITVKSVSTGIASASVFFWACSLLLNSIYQAYPVAPEHTWVEVSGILSNLVEDQGMLESFHQCALSVYPFSAKLWTSYYNFLKKKTESGTSVVQIAKERGIKVE